MRKKITLVTIIAFAYVAGYGYGRWYGPVAIAAAKGERKILYWHDPMHPSYKSGKPGVAPDCNMALTPVYDEPQPKPETPPVGLPQGTVRISPEKQALIGVRMETVETRPAFEITRAPARLGLDESKIYRVQTRLEGWFEEVYVTSVGAYVKKRQKLATIYNPQSLAAQQEWINVMKAKMLNEPGYSDGAAALARRKLELQGLSDEEIENIGRSRYALRTLALFSPINGVVLERNAFVKQKVTPETVYTIADLSKLWATADLLEYPATPVSPGESVTLRLAYLPGRVFHGEVDSVLPVVDTASRTLKVRAVFDNPDQLLKPEMYGEIEFRSGAGRRLTIPHEAVLDSGLKQVVFIAREGGYFEPRTVEPGRQFGDRIEILRGLKRGERVVSSGNFLIDSESRLRTSR